MNTQNFPPKNMSFRYPGGKSKACSNSCSLVSRKLRDYDEYREPFLGGGSVAIYINSRHIPDLPIWINDLYVPLVNFWVQLRDNGENLSERLKQIN
jgi:DNA adenine methylase